MNDQNLSQLLAEFGEAKSRMTKGIVFTAVGYFLFCFGCGFITLYGLGIILMIASFPFLGVGIPFLVTGIIRRIKVNNKINTAKRNNNVPNSDPYVSVVSQPTQENN